MRVQVISLSAVTLAAGIVLADDSKASPPRTAASSFDATVTPLFSKSCAACHNDRLASGGLESGSVYVIRHPLMSHREEWERILQKIRTGEMPPKGMPRPPAAQTDALMKFVQREVGKGGPQRRSRSRPRHRSPVESQRVLEHNSRSARRRFPRGEGFPDRRLRLRFRQHRRRADDFARADGEVHRRRRAHCRPGHRCRSAAQEAARRPSTHARTDNLRRVDSQHGRSHAPGGLGCRIQ